MEAPSCQLQVGMCVCVSVSVLSLYGGYCKQDIINPLIVNCCDFLSTLFPRERENFEIPEFVRSILVIRIYSFLV